jgi:hypothetical protein
MGTNENREPREELAKDVRSANSLIEKYGAATITEEIRLKDVTYLEAVKALSRQAAEQEAGVILDESIVGEPLDAVYALHKAMAKKFGWVDLRPTEGFWGETPPALISVDVDVNQTVQVPWGEIHIPGVEGYISPCAQHTTPDGLAMLAIHGKVKKKNRDLIAELVRDARVILRNESIYKGKALNVSFATAAEVGHGAPPTRTPKFLDLSHIREEELVFSQGVQEQVDVSLLEPIEGTEACILNGIPLKRTVLLAGEYGVGKSLMLAALGKRAPKRKWTYIHIDSVENLKAAINFARQFEPAVLVAEDIDQVVSGARNMDMNEILELIDGVSAKGRQLITVLTTNHPEKINAAMMRAGRIDAFINILPPDAKACERLVSQYARGLLDKGEDLTEVGQVLAGQKPSVIREVVERTKLAAQRRSRLEGKELSFKAVDLLVGYRTMKPHLELMVPKVEVTASPLERTLFELVAQALNGGDAYQRMKSLVPATEAAKLQLNGRTNAEA